MSYNVTNQRNAGQEAYRKSASLFYTYIPASV